MTSPSASSPPTSPRPSRSSSASASTTAAAGGAPGPPPAKAAASTSTPSRPPASLRPTAGVRWAEALPALIDHLLNAFHTPHRESFEALERMGDKVVSVHGDAPEWGARLRRLRALLAELVAELEVHMQKEERILFPWIVSGRGSSAGGPIQVMLADHDGAARLLEALRLEALDYTPPVGACATFRGFLGG
ncbi:MAG: hemerythrin domain-containing protein [bacterium]